MSSHSQPEAAPDSSIEGLLEHERRYLAARPAREESSREGATTDPRLVSRQRDLCGLALSGGGMRSATFNLGLLQGLNQLGLLGMFDYLATVSGGGYIGGFWTAWRHYQGQRLPPGKSAPPLFPANEHGSRGAKLSEVRHLREFSNFLSPRLGLLSLDTGRLIVALVSAIVPSLLAALSLIVLVLLLWRLLLRAVLVEGLPWTASDSVQSFISYALMLLMTCGVLCGCEWLLSNQDLQVKRSRRDAALNQEGLPGLEEQDAQELESRRFGYYLPTALLATGIVTLLWWRLMAGGYVRWGFMFAPAITWLVAAAALVILRWLGSRFMSEWMQRTKLAALDRIISRLLILALCWSVIGALWRAGWRLRELAESSENPQEAFLALKTGLVAAVTTLTGLFAKVQQFLGRRTSKPVSPSLKERTKSHLPQLLAYVTLALIVLGVVLLVHEARREGWLGWLAGGAGALTVLTLCFFDPNLVGLHVFYRGRLARTFIGAAHGEGPGQTDPHTKDDLPLDRLEPRPGPLHLICCAANDLSSADPMANLYRGADSAVLSSVGFCVGEEWKTWKELRQEGRPRPTLASAMTASGAAFNSHMGSMSMRMGPAVTFLMTTFNLRLGLWCPHPTRARRRWYDRALVGLPFYKELLGRSRARSRDVLLSDGGHFENLALYELIRRHCRFVLISDCGMDSDNTFDDFANAVRRVREDFGVEIRIDLAPLRSGKDGLARQPVVVGDIEYPDGDTGVLLLLKPTLTGNEPPDISQYKSRNADFPHETTGDQFYDEAQWEAYRRLGEHAALTAFRPLLESTGTPRQRVAQLFARARCDWLPVPTGYEERFSRFVARAAELDALLQRQESWKLFREVFKEISELDQQARRQFQEHEGMLSKAWPWRRAGGGGELQGGSSPSPQELSGVLHMLRLALLFMEEVFLAEDLANNYNHPAYMGLMNYFARWAYSELFRAWWPLLKTQYSPRFTRFLEQRFNLPPMSREDIGRLSHKEKGFAMSCWRNQGGRLPRDERREAEPGGSQLPIELLISYQLKMPCEGEPQYYIQAAQLIARIRRRTGERLFWDEDGSGGRQVVVWQGDDFYVPPGLWGAGIREDFLRRITSSTELLDTKAFGIARGSLLVVRILVDREASAARRHRWAEEVQFYRAHGFEEPGPELKHWLTTSAEEEINADPALPWSKRSDEHWIPYWLVRTYRPSEPDPRHAAGPARAHAHGEHEGPALH